MKEQIGFGIFFFILFIGKIFSEDGNVLQLTENYRRHENCDYWAEADHECVNNPRYMWKDCIGSCLQYAQDEHENCQRWASEGECTENPNYIHINCPRSCGMALHWNPWVRRHFEITDIELNWEDGKDRIDVPSNILEIGDILRERLAKFVNGLAAVVPGLSTSSPTEYLGMLGLSEAFLYALRVYEVIFQVSGKEDLLADHVAKINHVLQVLRAGFSSDKIMLQIPSWYRTLEDAGIVASGIFEEIVSNTDNVTSARVSDLTIDKLSDYLLGSFRNPDHKHDASTVSVVSVGQKDITLSNGVKMPLVGLGTWQLNGDDCYEAVYSAIKQGYRMIDSAQAYGNEKEVGRAIARAISEGVVKREELFIATKLSDAENAGSKAFPELFRKQLENLQVEYIDLYMLHSPLNDKTLQNETWSLLEEYTAKGQVHALGVSNFDSRDLTELFEMGTKHMKPQVLQNKLDLYHLGKQIDVRGDNIVGYAKENGIVMMAYSPFSSFPFVMEPREDPIVKYIAAKNSKAWGIEVTTAQIILKWITQRGMTVIPRSLNADRQKQNIDVLNLPTLSKEDMDLLDICQLLVSSPVSIPMLYD
jgi:alcohol dehydrogenase (NADP+)